VGLTIALQDIIRQHKIRHEELQAVKRTQAAELEAARKEVDCLVSELKTAQTQNEQHGDNSASIVAAVAVATVELRREKALIEEAHAETRRELIATQGTLAAKANMLQAREETMAAHAEMRHMKDRQIEALKRTEARLEEDIQARKTLMANFVAQKRELEERQSMLEAKLQTQRARVSKHKKALEESVVNVNGLMARQEKLSTAKKDALALVDQATAELNVLRLELAALKTPSNEQKNASQELVVQRDALMAELAELKKDSSGKISAQLAQLKSLEDARAGLAIQNEALTAEVKTLSTDFHAKNEDLGRLIAVTTDAGRLRDELVTAEQRIAGLLNAEGANRGELDQARIQIATLEETCAKQNEMLETWAAKEKTFSAKAEKMQLERQELKSELRKFKEVLKVGQAPAPAGPSLKERAL
jgi:chromosome segregation ATPase